MRIKEVNPKSSHHKRNIFSFNFVLYPYEMLFTNLLVIIIS